MKIKAGDVTPDRPRFGLSDDVLLRVVCTVLSNDKINFAFEYAISLSQGNTLVEHKRNSHAYWYQKQFNRASTSGVGISSAK